MKPLCDLGTTRQHNRASRAAGRSRLARAYDQAVSVKSEHPSAFITYAQRDPGWSEVQTAEWREEVHAFAAVLRSYGIDAKVDLFAMHERGVDWTRFGPRAVIENEWVIAAVSPAWRERYEGGNKPTEGAGAVAEADSLMSVFQDGQSDFRSKLVLVFLPRMRHERVPVGLHGVHRFRLDDFAQASIEDLLRLLTNQPRYPVPPLGRVPQFAAATPKAPAIASAMPDPPPSPSAVPAAAEPNGDPLQVIDEQIGALRSALRRMEPPQAGEGAHVPWQRAWHQLQSNLASLEAIRAEIESGETVESPIVADAGVASGPHPSAFEAEVIGGFTSDGWQIDRAGVRDVGFDFKARRGGEVLMVEVKARRRLGAADVQRVLEHLIPAANEASAIPVLAVPYSSVAPGAMEVLADTGVRLMQFRPE
jgi:Holliday junction resolvase